MSIACALPISTMARLRAAASVAPAGAGRARPNIVVRADSVWIVPMQVLRGWVAPGQECVVVDIDGRYAQVALSASDGRTIDAAEVFEGELRALLRARYRVSVLDFSRVPAAARSMTLGMALSVVAAHRARTGRPHRLIIDDAETVLNDPGIPPHALDLSEGGFCLVSRSPDGLSGSLAASIGADIVPSGLSDDNSTLDRAADSRARVSSSRPAFERGAC